MRIAIVAHSREANASTFIKQHIKLLRPECVLAMPYLRTSKRIRSIGLEPTWDWARRFPVRRVLERYQPDVILAEYGIMGAELVATAGPEWARRVVAYFHGYDSARNDILERYGRKYRRLFEEAAGIIAVSNDMRSRLEDLGSPPERTHMIPYSVDFERFQPRSEPCAQKRLIAVGRFTPKKSPGRTIRAFSKSLRSHPDATLRMIGDGPLLAECRALGKELGISDHLVFLGAQRHDVVAEEMRAARVFVQHSVVAPSGDREGTPVAALEAAASGLPIVSTRHEGLKEAIQDGVTGYLVDEGDIESMSNKINDLLADPQSAHIMGVAGRKHIEDNYSAELIGRKLSDLLKNIGSPHH
ncbi:glycosyltransferase [Stratiformator vulcanicus]|uniref:GDP-mannose-dependent alpha-(1-6)-phosphatidylinositol monomannoside mannosyltransferase n=1 Tax=Stratiformator vulcanicus TaxID=2527980 RepID=A0A517QVT8_9PLAN|nr:glycosyltransferase [Stratiformator vulcanicus]QDT35766.1 GDP-mannose-dependent alpha-(1-6)-phosphatidylinositol monomannoside mannosyltransferase [Stratiformator vulcanicus]